MQYRYLCNGDDGQILFIKKKHPSNLSSRTPHLKKRDTSHPPIPSTTTPKTKTGEKQ